VQTPPPTNLPLRHALKAFKLPDEDCTSKLA